MTGSVFLIAILGGLLALDETSVGQFQLSRPIVAGTLAGWALGEPLLGGLVGSLLELYALAILPAGGARFPGLGPGTVAAVASVVLGGPEGELGLAIGFALALGLGELDGMTIRAMRRMNGRWISGDTAPTRQAVVAAHLAGLVTDFMRATSMTLVGTLVGVQAVSRYGDGSLQGSRWALAIILIGATVSFGALLRAFGGWRARGAVFGTGVMLGTAVGWFL